MVMDRGIVEEKRNMACKLHDCIVQLPYRGYHF